MTKPQYKIDVLGHLWSGPLATYSQTLDELPPAVHTAFGDFETILDHRITKIETKFKQLNAKTRAYVRLETVEREMSEENLQKFEDLAFPCPLLA